MNRWRHIAQRALLAAFGLAAWGSCVPDDAADPDAPQTWERVSVTMDVAAEAPTTLGETRGKSPMTPDVENLIYDLWVVQFVVEGNFAQMASAEHFRSNIGDAGGTTALSFGVELLATDSYVCVIANRNPGKATQEFSALFDDPENVQQYETFSGFCEAQVTLDLASYTQKTAQCVLMSGYWRGTPTSGQKLTVPLSRMLTRINVTLNNNVTTFNTSNRNRLEVTLQNVAKKTYLFPVTSHSAWPKDVYTSLEIDTCSVKEGESYSLYYYTGPNFCTDPVRATTLHLRSMNNKHETAVVLGTDAPGTADRDLNLYPNTTYNITLNLEKPKTTEETTTNPETTVTTE